MQESVGTDGCPVFIKTIEFESASPLKSIKWGITLDSHQGNNMWGVVTEVKDHKSSERILEANIDFNDDGIQIEKYYFTYCRHLGANKYYYDSRAFLY